MCAESVKSELNLPGLKVDWVAVTTDNQFQAVEQHQIDSCADRRASRCQRRKQVDFSSPIFPGGVGVLVRSDAPNSSRNILADKAQEYTADLARRGAQHSARADVRCRRREAPASSGSRKRATSCRSQFRGDAGQNYDAGVQAVPGQQGERVLRGARGAAGRGQATRSGDRLTVIDRQFTYEPLALADRAGRRRLPPAGGPEPRARFYASPGFPSHLYEVVRRSRTTTAKNFFRWNALPE